MEVNAMASPSSADMDASVRLAELCSFRPYKEAYLDSTLSLFLSSKYVFEALNLPPSCNTIWNVIAEDMENLGAENPFPVSLEDDVMPYLRIFFSDNLLDKVIENLGLLERSFLGADYVLRRGKVVFAKTILDDIVEEHVFSMYGLLYNFLGRSIEAEQVDGDADQPPSGDGDWVEVTRRQRRQWHDNGRQREQEREARSTRPPPRRGTRGGRGGRGGDIFTFVSSRGAPFRHMTIIDVHLPYLRTPPKGTTNRSEMLGARSFAFKSHGQVHEGIEFIYDPTSDEENHVHLYHGTSSLEAFRSRGIDPPYRNNEFSANAAFYVTNSLQHAVEHPMHNHPGQQMGVNRPSVLVFDVDVRILHGERAPPGGDKFHVYWFPDDEEHHEAWLKFCVGNLERKLIQHSYDIVIGPMCVPIQSGAKKLQANLGANVKLTQVACCSQRARDWMSNCVIKAYCEKRANL